MTNDQIKEKLEQLKNLLVAKDFESHIRCTYWRIDTDVKLVDYWIEIVPHIHHAKHKRASILKDANDLWAYYTNIIYPNKNRA